MAYERRFIDNTLVFIVMSIVPMVAGVFGAIYSAMPAPAALATGVVSGMAVGVSSVALNLTYRLSVGIYDAVQGYRQTKAYYAKREADLQESNDLEKGVQKTPESVEVKLSLSDLINSTNAESVMLLAPGISGDVKPSDTPSEIITMTDKSHEEPSLSAEQEEWLGTINSGHGVAATPDHRPC